MLETSPYKIKIRRCGTHRGISFEIEYKFEAILNGFGYEYGNLIYEKKQII
jgi:hypothetical protein